jgi:hypothetical protein
MRRRAGTQQHPKQDGPDQQRTTPQERRAALHPRNARGRNKRPAEAGLKYQFVLKALDQAVLL